MAAEPLDLLRQNLDAVREELVQAMDAAQPVELDQRTLQLIGMMRQVFCSRH